MNKHRARATGPHSPDNGMWHMAGSVVLKPTLIFILIIIGRRMLILTAVTLAHPTSSHDRSDIQIIS